ncbi:hypothetical protein N7516_004869 [Penicillium verrucosum]|uniref:uncharacterized protein n=1 Tax=Penicillium verrucosum TaxID=60171 RepID=UPI00254526B9|nr:uncharacterized protein N7516_004869 [Penicillium verrucosum]KAJ5944701.1 hypothetical protein N7516_004869 [Penicillium verrucosum]
MSEILNYPSEWWRSATKGSWWIIPPTDEDEAEENFLKTRPKRRYRHHPQYIWPWILSTLFFASTTLVLFIRNWQMNTSQTSINGPSRPTDLEPAREWAAEHEIQFGGGLVYNKQGKLLREPNLNGEEWVGSPSPEMDALWDHIEAGSIILLADSEADMVRDKTTLLDGYWVTGLDVIHQVHCLNKVRKALYPEYYHPLQSNETEKLHVDYVRQAVMCNADISPVTHTWYESAQTFGPDFRTKHTCRNFEALLQWSLDRSTEVTKAKGTGPENAQNPDVVMPGTLKGQNHKEHGEHVGH